MVIKEVVRGGRGEGDVMERTGREESSSLREGIKRSMGGERKEGGGKDLMWRGGREERDLMWRGGRDERERSNREEKI